MPRGATLLHRVTAASLLPVPWDTPGSGMSSIRPPARHSHPVPALWCPGTLRIYCVPSQPVYMQLSVTLRIQADLLLVNLRSVTLIAHVLIIRWNRPPAKDEPSGRWTCSNR